MSVDCEGIDFQLSGVDFFDVESDDLVSISTDLNIAFEITIEDFCDVTTLLCFVGCMLWVGVGMYDGLVIQIVG